MAHSWEKDTPAPHSENVQRKNETKGRIDKLKKKEKKNNERKATKHTPVRRISDETVFQVGEPGVRSKQVNGGLLI